MIYDDLIEWGLKEEEITKPIQAWMILRKRSRHFFEFVMPAIDMVEEKNDWLLESIRQVLQREIISIELLTNTNN